MNIRGIFIKLIGHKKREEINFKKIKRVLISGGRIGDVVVKTPIFKELYKINKDIKIDISLCESAQSLVKYCPYINEILVGEDKKGNKIKRAWNSIIGAIKTRKKYDLYVDLSDNCRFIHILSLKIMSPRYLMGCYRRERFGIKRDELTIYDKYIETYEDDHVSDRNLRFIEELGIKIENRNYEIFLGDLERKYENYFDKNKINIIFNFRGSVEKRTMTEEEIKYFIENIPKLNEKIKVYILALDKDREKIEKLILKNEKIELLPVTKEVLEAAAIIKYCDCVFSVDTGIVHIAGAFNKPLLGIYPMDENNYNYFGPRMENYRVVRGKEKGSTIRGFSKVEAMEKFEELLKEIRMEGKI